MRRRVWLVWALLLWCTVGPAAALAQPVTPGDMGQVWPQLTSAERDQVMQFGEEFKDFMGRCSSCAKRDSLPKRMDSSRGHPTSRATTSNPDRGGTPRIATARSPCS